jgi:hypothetical protein
VLAVGGFISEIVRLQKLVVGEEGVHELAACLRFALATGMDI